jgi:mRNA deadenylase 3'-5' endonuclease subunit Ccr4
MDGCAIFWRNSRIKTIRMSNLELNEAAIMGYQREIQSLDQMMMQRMMSSEDYETYRGQCDNALKRVTRDNVAQVVVFQVTHSPAGEVLPTPVQFIAVNTHLFWDPAFDDVKLWQASVLLSQVQLVYNTQGERGAPLLLFGDFNSEPASNVYKLLTRNSPTRPADFSPSDLSTIEKSGVLKILPQRAAGLQGSALQALTHQLPLTSLFAAITGAEPSFTNLTRDYVGTLDYVWSSHGTVRPLAALAIPSADELTGGKRHRLARKDLGLGSAYGAGAFSAEGGGGGGSGGGSGSGGGGGGSPTLAGGVVTGGGAGGSVGAGGSGGGSPSLTTTPPAAGGAGGSPGADEMDGSEGLPNGAWPSDHLPLTFEVQLLN